MDSKERFLVDELCRRITQQIFHERDILALLILLRGHSAAKSPVRELADFIAHREKTLGEVKEYVHHVVAYGQALANGTLGQLKIDPVFTAAAFRDSLNSVLAGLSIPIFPNERTDDLLACTMSLLQDVRLIHEKKEIGRLASLALPERRVETVSDYEARLRDHVLPFVDDHAKGRETIALRAIVVLDLGLEI